MTRPALIQLQTASRTPNPILILILIPIPILTFALCGPCPLQ